MKLRGFFNTLSELEPLDLERLNEMAQPDAHLREQRLFHGTGKLSVVNEIIANGLKGAEIQGRSMMAPVKGRSYLTTSLYYAGIYAIGGDMFGHDFTTPRKDSDNDYGYILEFDGRELNDVQPDEDSIGQAIAAAFDIVNGKPPSPWDSVQDFHRAFRAEPKYAGILLQYANQYLTSNQIRKVRSGEYAYYAQAGKRLVKKLPGFLMNWLIKSGAHVAHAGDGLKPIRAYRIARSNIVNVKRDASDLADHLELFWERPLIESRETIAIGRDGYAREIDILFDPTVVEFLGFIKRAPHGELRALMVRMRNQSDFSLAVWNAYEIDHNDMSKLLKKQGWLVDTLHLEFTTENNGFNSVSIARHGLVQYGPVWGTRSNKFKDTWFAQRLMRFKAPENTMRVQNVVESINQVEIDKVADDIKQRYGLSRFELSFHNNGDLKLYMIAVPTDQRNSGRGSAAIEELCRFADAHGFRIVLSPAIKDPKWGTTSQSRLIKFYSRFGFVQNRGRNKDFAISDLMYRIPRSRGALRDSW